MIAFLKRLRRLMLVAVVGAVLAPFAAIYDAAMAGAPGESAAPQRIVSIGGDITEIVFALGLGDRIVALDTTSHYPADAVARKKSVGYMRALSTEGVLSVDPTLIIASGQSGPPEVIAALKTSTVPFVEIATEETPEGVARKIALVAGALGKEKEGEKLASDVRAGFAAVAAERAKLTKPVRALFILSLQGGRALVAGANTSAEAMFKLAGAENAVAGVEGFKPLNDEAALTAAPDVIVAMLRSDRANAGRLSEEIAAMKGLGASPAAKSGRIMEVDGSYMLQFGPRAPSAAIELMHKFYPELANAGGPRP
jgi:iron complex transport system substrate-binding protein